MDCITGPLEQPPCLRQVSVVASRIPPHGRISPQRRPRLPACANRYREPRSTASVAGAALTQASAGALVDDLAGGEELLDLAARGGLAAREVVHVVVGGG